MLKNNRPKRKLIRKASIGGFLSDISKITQEGLENLGKLGTAGKIAEIGINLFDPTGVTGWKELGEAVTALSNEKNATNFGKFVLAALGAMPTTSTAKKVQNILDGVNEGKDILKIINGAGEVKDASKIIKVANKDQDALKVLDKGQDASAEVAKIEGSEKIFRTTGATATVPPSIISAVDKLIVNSSEARKDKELAELSEFLHTSYRKNEKLPKEFVQYLRAIFKTPVMEKKSGTLTGKVKIKTSYTFKNSKDSQEAIDKLKIASKSIDKNTKEFKFSEAIRNEIYLKSQAYVQSFLDNGKITQAFRRNFNDIEVPEILNYQTSPEITQLYSKEQLAGPLGDYYRMGEEFAAGQRQLRKTLSDQYGTDIKYVPVYTVIKGRFKLIPKRIYNKSSQRWETRKDLVYLDEYGRESATPIEGIHDYYVRGYAPAVDRTPLMEHIITDVDQHHEKPLSQWMADAFIKNPTETDPKKLLETYLKSRPTDYYKGYIPLSRKYHTGSQTGIHSKLELTLSELTKIKGFARSLPVDHDLKDSSEIIDYLVKTKSEQEVMAILHELQPIQNKIIAIQRQLQVSPNNATFKESLNKAYTEYLNKFVKYSKELDSTTSYKISTLKKLIESAPERDIKDYEALGKSLRGGFEKVWLKSVSKQFSDAELGKIATMTEAKLLEDLKKYKGKNITLFSVDDSNKATYDIYRGNSRIGYVTGDVSEGIFTPAYVKSLGSGNNGIFERGINSVIRSGYKYRTGDQWASPKLQKYVIETRFTNPKGIEEIPGKGRRYYSINEKERKELEDELSSATGQEYQDILEILDNGYRTSYNQPVYLISKLSNKKGTRTQVANPIVRHRFIPSLERIGPDGLRNLIDYSIFKSGGKLPIQKFNIFSLGKWK